TGRTHQIRVHFAAIGHPVAGDAVYGQKESWVKRQFLHAHRLSFALPSNGQVVEFTSPLPPDLEEALKILETPS
ncbi:RNA pseudouridine synthase, partial [Dehalococcoides mccartyi]